MCKKEVPYEYFESEVLKNNGIFFEKHIVGFNRLHTHDFYEIEMVISGKGRYMAGGKEFEVQHGFLTMAVPGESHQMIYEEPVYVFTGCFSEEYISKKSLQLLNGMQKQHFFLDEKCYERYLREFEQLIDESEQKEKNDDLCRNIIERILIFLVNQAGTDNHSGLNSANVDEAVAWVSRHFRENISLVDTAEMFNYSPNYFSEIFHEKKGVSFKQYLINIRLDSAKKLLDRMNISVADLCIECGFNDATHFSKSFKKKFGVTPSQYRRNKSYEI